MAASYGVGAVGGLIYLRLLNRSVDGVGLGGALGQPRLLIPVILALGYNRRVPHCTALHCTALCVHCTVGVPSGHKPQAAGTQQRGWPVQAQLCAHVVSCGMQTGAFAAGLAVRS